MNEIYQLLIGYGLGIWRRRWYAIAVTWLMCGAGWAYVAGMPDRYQSSARIYVDVDTMLGPLMRGIAVQMNTFQQIDIMRRTLMSQPNIEKMILMTDLDLTVRNDQQKEALISNLRQNIRVGQQGRNLFQISYEHRDKALTKRVVQAVMQIFVEGNLGASRKDMDSTQRFLKDQIRDYERQLVETENKLAMFRRENTGFLPGSGNYYQHMRTVRGNLAKTQSTIDEATMVRDELRNQLKDVPQFVEVVGDASAGDGSGSGTGPESGLQFRILELQQVIDSLLTRYTEKHPDVVSTTKRMNALQKELEQEQAAQDAAIAEMAGENPSGTEAPGTVKNSLPNPVYEQIKLQLVKQEGVIAALNSRAAQARKEVEKWTKLADLAPQAQSQLMVLTRDHSLIKGNYEKLRSRLESVKMAQELETKAQKVQFRVIDPPKLPIKPSGPNRPMFHVMVLLAGIGGGIAFAFVLSQINATFSTVQRLRSTFTLPVLGRISAVVFVKDSRRRLRELISFGMVFSALLFAFLGLLSIEKWGAEKLIEVVNRFVTL